MIRILLGQRNALLCGALAAVLSDERDLPVVAELTSGDQVVAAVVAERPQVAVLDGELPGAVTIGELCRRLLRTVPDCHPLLLLDHRADAGLARSLAPLAPWLGLLATEADPAGLVAAVRQLAGGAPTLDPLLVSGGPGTDACPLTERESEVLRLTAQGAPPKEIARRLGLHPGTVRNYLSRSVAKTGARTRLEAVRTAREAGWL